MSNTYIELHILQNVAPSCLNRDENNAPKDCDFGGVRRARVSSQSWKRAMRQMFRENSEIPAGYRTKRLKKLLLERIGKEGQEADAAVALFISTYLSGFDKAENKADLTNVLLYLGDNEIDELAEIIQGELWEELVKEASKESPKLKKDKKLLESLKSITGAADVSLFGRMMAENPELRVDAACQVAHAISTHRVDREMDFFTAVDDLNPGDETGAGMMGVTEFNSACMYRYALLDTRQLAANLHSNDANLQHEVMRAFMHAFVRSIPGGKQNTFAAHNLPSFGLFVVRKDGAACSLANAFAKPVYVGHQEEADLVGESVSRLSKYLKEYREVYGDAGIAGMSLFQLGVKDRLNGLADHDAGSVDEAIEKAMEIFNTVEA